MNEPPAGVKGLWHVALNVKDLRRSQRFYEQIFGMQVVWQPDADNVYLTSGRDNLALHQITPSELPRYERAPGQYLDHLGFIMESPETVDRLFIEVERRRITIVKPPKQHRDGSYSFYLADPDGNTVQVLYEPTVSAKELHT